MRHLVVALAMALLLSGSALSAGSGIDAFITNSVPALDGKTFVSVVDSGGVSPISVGSITHGVAMDPTGARVYAASALGTQGAVYAIDARSKAVIGSVTFSSEVNSPFGIAVSPDGKHLFLSHGVIRIVNRKPKLFPGFLSVVDVATNADGTVNMSVAKPPLYLLPLQGSTTGVAVGTWGGAYRVYVANGSGYISVIDPTSTHPVVATVGMDSMHVVSLVGLAVSTDGSRLYAADTWGNKLWVVDATQVGSGAEVIASIDVGKNPFGVAVSPKDGAHIFVANAGSDNVSVIEKTSTGYRVIATPDTGMDNPHGIAFTSDGAKVYVVNRGLNRGQPSVSVLNGTTGAWIGTLAKDANLNSPVGFGTFTFGVGTVHVRIDIVPSVVNRKAQGTLPVVIFSSDGSDPDFPTFDVHALTVDDFRTLRLNGLSVKIKPNDEPMVNYGDFNGDGLDDVMVHFSMDGALDALAASSDSATLEGQTSDGMSFQGADSVKFLH